MGGTLPKDHEGVRKLMNIIIGQPKMSNTLSELNDVLNRYQCDVLLFPEGYIHGQNQLDTAALLAKKHQTAIISSHLNEGDNRNLSSAINEAGQIVFTREKSTVEGPLILPSAGHCHNMTFGYMLCREIFLDFEALKDCDIIFNPIGVGMFSEEQYQTWTERARHIAITTNSYVIGASHADGSYRNCGFSIPLSFVYKPDGTTLFISKNDTRTVNIDLETETITHLD